MKTFFGVFPLGFNKPRSGLEQLAYLCGSDLIHRYKARFQDDPFWNRPACASRYKKWSVGLLVVCASVFLTGLPELPVNEVSGSLNHSDFRVDTRPVTRPLSHLVWNMRGKIYHEAPAPSLELLGLTFAHNNAEGLTGSWLADLSPKDGSPRTNAALWAYVEPGDMFPKIPELAPENLAPFSVGGGEVMNNEGAPLRWNAARQTCEVSPALQNQIAERLEALKVRQTAHSRSLQARAERYQQAVEQWSRRFKLNPDLLYAIIYTESSFNPQLVSNRDAHGLMQVVPRTAGGEVKAWLGEKGTPSPEELLNPVTNIKYGAAYFHLLLKRHFPKVKDALSREYCALAAYNAGSGAVFKVFGPTREDAVKAINELNADEVLAMLMKGAARETRGFLKKVIASRTHFIALN